MVVINLETEGKINLLVTFIQLFVTQSKLSLIFIKILIFPYKTAYFLNNSHDSYKNAGGNSKIPLLKIDFLKKQSIKAKAEVKASVNLANKYKVKAKNFIIPIFYFSVFFLACCNT